MNQSKFLNSSHCTETYKKTVQWLQNEQLNKIVKRLTQLREEIEIFNLNNHVEKNQ